MNTVDFNALEKRTKPRDLAWDNWKKWEQIGDVVQGFIRDVFYREPEGDFGAQRVLTIEQEDKTLINVPIKHFDFILAKTDDMRLNDPIKITYVADLPAKVKHHSPTKQFEYYGPAQTMNPNEKTVKELEAEDRKIVESQAAEKEAAEAQANAEFEGNAAPAASGDAPAGPNDLPFENNTPAAPAPQTASSAPQPEAPAPAPAAQPTAAPAPEAPTQPVAPAQPAAPTQPSAPQQ